MPHQHGAWALLVLPLVLATSQSEWSPTLLVLVPAWVAAYPLSWALSEVASARHPDRYRRAALLWAAAVAPLVFALLVLRPWLWLPGLAYLALFGVNVTFARSGAERSMANDLVLVTECTAMVPITTAVAAGGSGWLPPYDALTVETTVLSVLCALALTGSTLHVKSLIRERSNPAFAAASRAFAIACVPVPVAASYAWGPGGSWLVLPFVLMAVRAWWPDMRGWRPARVGLVELACFLAVALSAFLAR